MTEMKYQQLDIIRQRRPLIQSITNSVTTNDCANVLLAVGASPIMAHNVNEVAEVQKSANGLLLNLGATDDYDAFIEAAVAANKAGHPVVLDPVGVTISSYRRDFLYNLMSKVHIDCIRCNYGEALACCKNRGAEEGLDSQVMLQNEEDRQSFIETLQDFSKKNNLIIAASGAEDIVVSKDEVYTIKSGSAYMKNVTGMGCMCSEIVCAFMCADASVASVAAALSFYGDCGIEAESLTASGGTMTFKNNFIDCISKWGCLCTN